MKKESNKEINKDTRVTERALYASLLAVVLCCVMLFENTYAWFTQTVSTPVSVIQTGNFSAKLVLVTAQATFMDAGESVDESGENIENNLIFREYDIVNKDGSLSTVFEPGKSYCLPELYVQNTGNIDLNFTVTLAHDPTVMETVSIGTTEEASLTKEDGSTEVLSLYDVLSFVAYVTGENGELDLEHPIPLTVARGESDSDSDAGSEGSANDAGDAGDGNGAEAAGEDGNADSLAENGEKITAEGVVKGVLLAPKGEEVSISKSIVIQATMDKDAGIEYAGLELSGLQIIVNTSQVIPESE